MIKVYCDSYTSAAAFCRKYELKKNLINFTIYYDVAEEHIINGKLHREDGPAHIDIDADEHYYINGTYIYFPENVKTKKQKIRYMKNRNFW